MNSRRGALGRKQVTTFHPASTWPLADSACHLSLVWPSTGPCPTGLQVSWAYAPGQVKVLTSSDHGSQATQILQTGLRQIPGQDARAAKLRSCIPVPHGSRCISCRTLFAQDVATKEWAGGGAIWRNTAHQPTWRMSITILSRWASQGDARKIR